MKKYALNIEDRKVLVSRLMELNGLHSRYTFMPRCAYIVGSYTVEKEGTLVIEENAEQEIIQTLLDEGIIRDEDAPQTEATNVDQPEQDVVTTVLTGETEVEDQPDEEPESTAEESAEVQDQHVLQVHLIHHMYFLLSDFHMRSHMVHFVLHYQKRQQWKILTIQWTS